MRGMIGLALLAGFAVGFASAPSLAGEWTRQTTWNRHGWKNLLGQSPDEATASKSAGDEPSFFEKMNNGTKEFFARTSSVFLRERNQPVIHPPKPGGGAFSKSKAPKKKKSAWSGADEPGVPQTVNEWMKLKRPEASL